MTVLIIEEFGYTARSDVKWADDMALYIRHGEHEVPGARSILKLEPRDDGEVAVIDITDECNDELERAADPSPTCHKYSSRYAAYEAERLGGAA